MCSDFQQAELREQDDRFQCIVCDVAFPTCMERDKHYHGVGHSVVRWSFFFLFYVKAYLGIKSMKLVTNGIDHKSDC